ncbi:MAG: family finger-like protein [Deltaproteobacteria bacterium]|nr:family finger-like protein [Deltaproteobacteria bacterium]
MIIQCDHCSAKFRIDDAKLANGAVKVRCAKCKEVFVVDKEESSAASLQPPPAVVQPPTTEAPTDFTSDSSSERSDFSFNQEQAPEHAGAEIKSSVADEFDWKDTSVSLDRPAATAEFDASSFASTAVSKDALQPQAAADADNDFDFGDINLQSTPAEVKPSPQEAPPEDFSIDFGEVSFAQPPPSSAVTAGSFPEASAADFSFDAAPSPDSAPAAGHDDFLLSFNADQADEPKPPDSPAEGGGSVNFGDFSFGEMADGTKSDHAAAHEHLSSPDQDLAPAPFPSSLDEDLVPASLLSRKSPSRFPLFLILGAILLIVALGVSGVYFFGGPKAFSRVGLGFLVDWYGDKNAEEGSMTIRNLLSSYVVNSSAGELFVVKGEAVNNFKKPRASVQVKLSILGPGGVVLASKSAFCGNSLSNDQLASLSLVKIEEAMNNQFGDSLANLGVKPGSAIPFVIVMSAVPKEATDYSVQIAGSTVATQ